MMKRSFACMVLAAFCRLAAAASWPSHTVTFIVPFPAGGATDIPARVVASGLEKLWKTSVVVEDRPGAAGAIGAAYVSRMKPDGYTLLFPSGSVMTANQYIYSHLGYDPVKDFSPISIVVSEPMLVLVPKNSPYMNLGELIAAARKSPGKLSFGDAGVGSQSYLAGEKFVAAAGIRATEISYRGDPPALADLSRSNLSFCVTSITSAISLVKSGVIRALAVTSPKPYAGLPGVPAAASTLPGFSDRGWFGLVAPAGTPASLRERISRDVAKVAQSPQAREKLERLGMNIVCDTPAQMDAAMQKERKDVAALVKKQHLHD